MAMTGGEWITRALQAHGVGTVFAVAGASHTHLLEPLDRAGVAILSHRHEAGAVGAADGYARAGGALGVALIVADQGLPNAVGALAVAWHAQTPVLVLVAAPPRVYREADAAIDQDRLALVAPLTRWARTVPDAARLADHVETAVKHARAGAGGPVVLLIPENLLQAPLDTGAVTPWPAPAAGAAPPGAVKRAAALLAAAERPLVVAGAGAAKAGAEAPLRALAERHGMPVFMNGLGRGLVPEDGRLGFAWPYAQPAAARADVVLVAGARLTQRLGLGLPPRFAADARFIQADIDPAAMHRNRPVDVPLLGDARASLDALVAELEGRAPRFDTAWVTDALVDRAARVGELAGSPGPAIHPLRLAAAIEARRDRGGIFLADGADIATWLYGAVRIDRPRGFMDHYPMGAMGSCTALAVGAAAFERERAGDGAPPVVLVTGDGALGFHPAELHAAVRAKLNLKVFVGNDGAWGTELHGQRAAIGRDVNTRLGQLPYEKLGEAFGATGLSIETTEALDDGVRAAFEAPGTVLVNVLTDPEAGAELKTNDAVRMIVFSDILSGQADLAGLGGQFGEADG